MGSVIAKQRGDELKLWEGLRDEGYLKKGLIGSGGFSSVFKSWSTKHNKLVAVKIVNKEEVDDDDSLPLELGVWSKLDHPNLVPLIDMYMGRGWIYFITEYSHRGDLHKWLSDGNFQSLPKRCSWIHQLADALCYMKSLGFTHGDIKPANILIFDENNNVKLCDFGSIKHTDVKSTNFSGTLGFLAPEVYYKKPYDASKADVWSLGLTFYFLIVPEKYNDVLKNDLMIVPVKKLSNLACGRLLRRMLQQKPSLRISISEVCEHPQLSQYRQSTKRKLSNVKEPLIPKLPNLMYR